MNVSSWISWTNYASQCFSYVWISVMKMLWMPLTIFSLYTKTWHCHNTEFPSKQSFCLPRVSKSYETFSLSYQGPLTYMEWHWHINSDKMKIQINFKKNIVKVLDYLHILLTFRWCFVCDLNAKFFCLFMILILKVAYLTRLTLVNR